MADRMEIATGIVARALATRFGVADLGEYSRLVDVIPSYPSEESKRQVILALSAELESTMPGLTLDVELYLHETTLFGDVVQKVAGGIPPRVFKCPRGDVISMAPGTCPTHHLALT